MSDERDREFWSSLERRISDVEGKLSQTQRDYQRDVTQLTHEVKEITNRVNHGLSNSVNDVKIDNVNIKLAHSELRHDLEKSIHEMRGFVNTSTDLTKLMVNNFADKDLKPVKEEISYMKKTFIYGLVGALIVFVGQKAIGVVWERIFDHDRITTTATVTTHQ